MSLEMLLQISLNIICCIALNITCNIITARKRSLEQGNVFTPVCHSVHKGGGWLPSMHYRSHDQGVCIQGVGQTLPHTWDTVGYGQQVGGTHPTGMLSC